MLSDEDEFCLLCAPDPDLEQSAPPPRASALVLSEQSAIRDPVIVDDDESDWEYLLVAPNKPAAPTLGEIASEQKENADFLKLRRWIESGEVPNPDSIEDESPFLIECAQNLNRFKLEENVILIRDKDVSELFRILVPETLRDQLVDFFHAGPMGAHEGYLEVDSIVRAFLLAWYIQLLCSVQSTDRSGSQLRI